MWLVCRVLAWTLLLNEDDRHYWKNGTLLPTFAKKIVNIFSTFSSFTWLPLPYSSKDSYVSLRNFKKLFYRTSKRWLNWLPEKTFLFFHKIFSYSGHKSVASSTKAIRNIFEIFAQLEDIYFYKLQNIDIDISPIIRFTIRYYFPYFLCPWFRTNAHKNNIFNPKIVVRFTILGVYLWNCFIVSFRTSICVSFLDPLARNLKKSLSHKVITVKLYVKYNVKARGKKISP